MTVKELKALINDFPDEMEIFVGCEGYTNYNFKSGKIFDDSETNLIIYDGKIFLVDSCAIEDESGKTI